jgi:trk system potassium uptake protein TrkA
MRVVIAGCGRVGSDLALRLTAEGHDVSVVDNRDGVFNRLGSTFNGTKHEGLAYDIGVLREAGIEFADAFVAVTDTDNANLMAVQIAKQVFGVEKTLARLDDPARADAYRALGVRYIAGAKLAANVFHEQLVADAFRYHVTFSRGDVEITEMVIGHGAAGMTVAEFEIPDDLRVAAVQRRGITHVVSPEFVLEPDDLVVAATRTEAYHKVRHLLRESEES